MTTHYQQQAGVSLIEVLVTTLILGIGLLGVAALQVSSISSNQEGFFASQATSIAEDLASRIRTSKMGTQVPDTDISHTLLVAEYRQEGNSPIDCSEAAAPMCRSNAGNAAADCTWENLIGYDKWEMCKIAEDTLPEGKVRVINNGRRLTVVVDWASVGGREDIGSETIVNASCAGLTGSSDRNCIIMELVP